MHIVPSKNSTGFLLSARDALPHAPTSSHEQAQAGGRAHIRTLEGAPQNREDLSHVLHDLKFFSFLF